MCTKSGEMRIDMHTRKYVMDIIYNIFAFLHACVYICCGSFAERNPGRINQKLWPHTTDVGRVLG